MVTRKKKRGRRSVVTPKDHSEVRRKVVQKEKKRIFTTLSANLEKKEEGAVESDMSKKRGRRSVRSQKKEGLQAFSRKKEEVSSCSRRVGLLKKRSAQAQSCSDEVQKERGTR